MDPQDLSPSSSSDNPSNIRPLTPPSASAPTTARFSNSAYVSRFSCGMLLNFTLLSRRHIRSRITVVCAEVSYQFMLDMPHNLFVPAWLLCVSDLWMALLQTSLSTRWIRFCMFLFGAIVAGLHRSHRAFCRIQLEKTLHHPDIHDCGHIASGAPLQFLVHSGGRLLCAFGSFPLKIAAFLCFSSARPSVPLTWPFHQCKRLKLKCDRRTPCSSCVKRDTVSRCQYSAAAAEKMFVFPFCYCLHAPLTS